jgi:hypothetical protein
VRSGHQTRQRHDERAEDLLTRPGGVAMASSHPVHRHSVTETRDKSRSVRGDPLVWRLLKAGISILASRSAPLYTKRPSAWAGCVRGSCFQLPTPSAAFTLRSHMPEATGCQGISWTPLPCCALSSPAVLRSARRTSARRQRQGPDPLQHRPEQASGQMTLRQQQPVVPRVFHQAPSRLDEALLETGQRPRVDPRR